MSRSVFLLKKQKKSTWGRDPAGTALFMLRRTATAAVDKWHFTEKRYEVYPGRFEPRKGKEASGRERERDLIPKNRNTEWPQNRGAIYLKKMF